MPARLSQQSRCQNRDELLLCRTQRHPAPHSPRPGGEAEARDPFARHPASPEHLTTQFPHAPTLPSRGRPESRRPAAPHAVFPMGRPTGTSKRFVAQTRAHSPSRGRAERPRPGILSLDTRYHPNVSLLSSHMPQHSPSRVGRRPRASATAAGAAPFIGLYSHRCRTRATPNILRPWRAFE